MTGAPLDVVAAYANPLLWRSRMALFRRFAAGMLHAGARLTVVECAFGRRPFELADGWWRHIGVRARSLVWTKENLLNIGLSRLPDDWKYAAWIDADVTFRRRDWAEATVQALQLHPIVQPWSDCYDLGPNDEHVQHHRSFAAQYAAGARIGIGKGYTFAHPGYAWAATRDALDGLGGLIETAALGAGDHHMALALIGRGHESMPGGVTPTYRAQVMAWQERARRVVAGNLGVVPGTIEHMWHGPKASRRYVERWDVLVRHRFCPLADLMRNTWGVLELAGNKPALRRDMDRYFRQRDEDANTITAP